MKKKDYKLAKNEGKLFIKQRVVSTDAVTGARVIFQALLKMQKKKQRKWQRHHHHHQRWWGTGGIFRNMPESTYNNTYTKRT